MSRVLLPIVIDRENQQILLNDVVIAEYKAHPLEHKGVNALAMSRVDRKVQLPESKGAISQAYSSFIDAYQVDIVISDTTRTGEGEKFWSKLKPSEGVFKFWVAYEVPDPPDDLPERRSSCWGLGRDKFAAARFFQGRGYQELKTNPNGKPLISEEEYLCQQHEEHLKDQQKNSDHQKDFDFKEFLDLDFDPDDL